MDAPLDMNIDILIKKLQSDTLNISKLVKRVLELQTEVKTLPDMSWYQVLGKLHKKNLYRALAKFSKKLDTLVKEQEFLFRELEVKKILEEEEKRNANI